MFKIGHDNPKLILIVDETVEGLGLSLLCWIIEKLTLENEAVAIFKMTEAEYQSFASFDKETVIVLMGKGKWGISRTIFERFAYNKLLGQNIYLSHGVNYALMNPAECHEISRVIYLAAKKAGMTPKVNLELPVFDKFPDKLK